MRRRNAGLQAAIQVLRLESDPLSHGNEDHQITYEALRHDIENADLLTRMAAAAAPESTVQALKADPENDNGGPAAPKPN